MGEGPRLPPAWRLVARDETDSTSSEARRLAEAGAPEGTLVWARRQTAGRGRLGRSWASPPGNLYASLVLRPALPPARAAELSLVAAVALAEAVAGLLPAGAPVALKWPNDLLIGGAKCAGILLEAAMAPGGGLDFLVLGIGVNLAGHPADTPYRATDLAAAGATVAPGAMLEALTARLHDWLGRWRAAGLAPVRAAWLARAHGKGGPIDVRAGSDLISGTFADLDADGALVIETAGGGRRRITAGDVVGTAAPTA